MSEKFEPLLFIAIAMRSALPYPVQGPTANWYCDVASTGGSAVPVARRRLVNPLLPETTKMDVDVGNQTLSVDTATRSGIPSRSQSTTNSRRSAPPVPNGVTPANTID